MSPIPREGEEAVEGPRVPREEPAAPLDRATEREMLGSLRAGTVRWEPTEELWRLSVEPAQWVWSSRTATEGLGHRLSTLFADRTGDGPGGLRVHALFLGRGSSAGVHLSVGLDPLRPRLASLVDPIPYVAPFEREAAESFGVEFEGARDRRPLRRHGARDPEPRPAVGDPPAGSPAVPADRFAAVEGEGVHEIAVGPVHAGVIEPGHFRFQVVGERILRLEIRLGYTHKGTERLLSGRPADLGTIWAESISGDMSLAGAMAYAQAVERARGSVVAPADDLARGLLLELERTAFLLGDLAGIALDVGYAVGAARANGLREEAYRTLARLTGSRLGRSILAVGGLRRPLLPVPSDRVAATLVGLGQRTRSWSEELLDKSSVLDRLEGTGTLPRWVAELVPCVGPVARASGLRRDLRADRPYGPYRGIEVRVPRAREGDVKARFQVKVAEIEEACRLAGQFLEARDRAGTEGYPSAGPSVAVVAPSPTDGLGWVESPRGEFLVHVRLDPGGTVGRVHVRDPSFLNWPALEWAVRGNIVPDFPLINKSFNLSYSGYDR